ncbi:hypothetical protein BKA62DRAFT_102396 [Auriculariales sp. MPI-PUGE-AT-0066]|nr:hypothetical protein BKA62DRAFT_102396 [Auriculariales sp. MPI-PUGE-AT-0066]
MMALGGQGYMEETEIARLIRDQLVERVWEGTGAVLTTDLLRAAGGDDQPLTHWITWVRGVIHKSKLAVTSASQTATARLDELVGSLAASFGSSRGNPLLAPALLDAVGYATAGVLLLEHAAWSQSRMTSQSSVDCVAFERWILEELPRAAALTSEDILASRIATDQAFVFGGTIPARL